MKKILLTFLMSIIISCSPSVLKNVSVEGLSYIGTDIYYNNVMIAKLESIEYAYDNDKLVREITYTIVDEEYNHLAVNIIKFCLDRNTGWEVEVQIKR